MDFARAIRIKPDECIAFIGAGGKTTALFRLARLVPPPVLVTTTTHLSIDQLPLADRVNILDDPGELHSMFGDQTGEVILLIGEEKHNDRVMGLPDPVLAQVADLAKEHGIPLLIEADGSRQRPMKAPADHEPVIPGFVDSVVVVAGLSALGEFITRDWVHRPELFADLVGLRVGETISSQAIISYLCNPSGGLKGIPPGARRICLLNQADTTLLQAAASRIAREILSEFAAVIVASLVDEARQGKGETDVSGIMKLDDSHDVYAVYEPVGGIILAAGGSKRFGRTKQLLPWRGKPLVRHVALAALSADFSFLVVVAGSSGDAVEAALEDLPLEIVINPDWQSGQSTSVQAGLRALPSDTGAAIFLLADQPQVSTSLIQTLIDKHSTTLAPIIAPIVDGKRGNPVLFDKIAFSDLLSLRGDTGGRAVFSCYPVTWIEWLAPGVFQDIDTEDDYKRLIDQSY